MNYFRNLHTKGFEEWSRAHVYITVQMCLLLLFFCCCCCKLLNFIRFNFLHCKHKHEHKQTKRWAYAWVHKAEQIFFLKKQTFSLFQLLEWRCFHFWRIFEELIREKWVNFSFIDRFLRLWWWNLNGNLCYVDITEFPIRTTWTFPFLFQEILASHQFQATEISFRVQVSLAFDSDAWFTESLALPPPYKVRRIVWF